MEAPRQGSDGAASYAAPEPSHDELFADVRQVRRRGAGNVDKPLSDLYALLWAARIVSQRPADAEKIEDALEQASRRLGGTSANAIPALLGLVPETRGRGVAFRRKAAAERHDYMSADSFRSHHETQLLMAIATQLLLLVGMKRLAAQEARVADMQRQLVDDLLDFNKKQKELVADYLPVAQLRRQIFEAMTAPSLSSDLDQTKLDKRAGVRTAFRRRRQK